MTAGERKSGLTPLAVLLREVEGCSECAGRLPQEPRPILQAHADAGILIAGQAPGRKAHAVGVPFADASGDRLRNWLGVTADTFYDPRRFAILPMGFCYPGTGRGGDLPPRPECATLWRAKLLARMPSVRLTVVLGRYALAYHLPNDGGSVTDAVRAWRAGWPAVVPLPHPSPRNANWVRRNPWFESELLPELRARVAEVLAADPARDKPVDPSDPQGRGRQPEPDGPRQVAANTTPNSGRPR